jgi:hypothetical protein
MLVNLRSPAPPSLSGPTLVDGLGLPRFWAAVWASFMPADLAPATVGKKLGQIERFYQHADALLGPGGLDNALADFNVESLRNALEGYFLSIRNSSSITEASEERWQLAIQFVFENSERRSGNYSDPNLLLDFKDKLRDLELIRSQLHIGRRRRPERVRSLPSEVVEHLYQLLDPESSINPFQNEASRWRVFVSFIIMLHQGLRRGELLTLPVDVIKCSFDRSMKKDRYWMNVKYNEYEGIPATRSPASRMRLRSANCP